MVADHAKHGENYKKIDTYHYFPEREAVINPRIRRCALAINGRASLLRDPGEISTATRCCGIKHFISARLHRSAL